MTPEEDPENKGSSSTASSLFGRVEKTRREMKNDIGRRELLKDNLLLHQPSKWTMRGQLGNQF